MITKSVVYYYVELPQSISAVEKIKRKLSNYPQVTCQEEDGMFIIHSASPSGFEIIITKDPSEYTVCFGCWHGHFDSEDDVVDFVGFGLSDRCRVRELRRGKSPYKWFIESNNDGVWQVCYTTGLIFFPFWKSKSEVIYQNNIIPAS